MTLFDGEVATAAQPRQSGTAASVAEVTHRAIREQLSEYLDKTLEPRDRERVDAHLAGCQACRAYLGTLRATTEALAQLPRVAAPDGVRQRLLNLQQD